jgi:preprotein translocase subunit YajC
MPESRPICDHRRRNDKPSASPETKEKDLMPTLSAARRLSGPAVLSLVSLASLSVLTGSAFAQDPAAPGGAGAIDIFTSLMPILLLIVIFWLLIFRPQQKRMKQQKEMLSAIRRGDTVVTSGGIIGKVTKAVDGEDLEVEIAPNTRVKIVRHMVSDVRSKAEPVNDNKPA